MIIFAAIALTICAPGPRYNCVHDGDTVWLNGEKMRIADIDTPKLNGQCDYERSTAVRARNRLVQLLNGGKFQIERTGHDRYGRTLAIFRRSGQSIGEQLVSEGLARKWSGHRELWCNDD